MRIRMKRNTVANKVAVDAGQVVDVPDTEARLLIGLGKAELVDASPSGIETADASAVAVETADVKSPRSKK